jgi:mycoredoxin
MDSSDVAEIVVYWRPGCGFCTGLRRQLDAHAVRHRLVNIWEDPAAAAHVRSVARGNETVPTVTIGPVSLVNPTLHEVVAAAQQHAPEALPEGLEVRPPRGLARLIGKVLRIG